MPRTKMEFGIFWDAYAHKRDRIGAERVWNRMSDRDRRAALAGIAAYREDCRRHGIAMMYAKNYLAHRRWEQEEDDDPCTQQQEPPSDALAEMEEW